MDRRQTSTTIRTSSAIEPVVLVALLIVIVAATFLLTGYSPHARAVLAAVVPLQLAIACWLLSVRLERRARTQEYALIEAFLGLNGNLAHAFPPRTRRARDRVEARTPLLQLAVQDALEMARETPCAPTRTAAAWVGLVLALTTVEQWAWQVVLHKGPTSLLMVAVIGPCLALFAVACNDLRQGRVRSLTDPRRVRQWGEGYRPEPAPTVLPSAPVLLLFLVPAVSLGVNWAARGSLSAHISIMEVVFGLWLLAWNARGAVTSPMFRRVERLSAPLDDLIRRGLTPTWDLLFHVCRWSGWGSAVLLTLALSWPASIHSGTPSTLDGVSTCMLVVSMILGPLVLSHWRRPVSPRTRSAQQFLREQGETQIRRMSMLLNLSLGASMLLLVVLGGLI
jgi:hypothetical protein